jgi:hypothetical protein
MKLILERQLEMKYGKTCAIYKIPDGLALSGAILSDRVKSLDWKARKAEFGCKLPSASFDEVVKS